MGKFRIGEIVKFRDAEIGVSAIPSLVVRLKTEYLSGRVTGVVDCGPDETRYYVDVKMPVKDLVVSVTLNESQLMSTDEYAHKVVDDVMKEVADFRSKILCTDNPDPYSWLNGFLNPTPLTGITEKTAKDLSDRIAAVRSGVMRSNRYVMGLDIGAPEGDKSALMVTDGGNGTGDGDKKMSRERCVKLLEAYRAEREKLKNGRRFERCLRGNVVDEALKRAIELLKDVGE